MTRAPSVPNLVLFPLEFRLESSHRDLELAVHAIVSALAAERGVDVKATRLNLRSISEHELDFAIVCEVRAMIVSATLNVRGRAVIGDDLCARFDELVIDGDGMIAGLAKAALGPKLDALKARPFPIADLKLPGLVVDGVAVSVGETVCLTATLKPSN